MGWFDQLRGALAGPELGRAERTATLVPAAADYVTLGQYLLLPDARAFIAESAGGQSYRKQYGRPPAAEPRPWGLLVLASGRLQLIGDQGELWSAAVGDITDLDGHRHGGFVVVTRGAPGVMVTTQAPVAVPAGARWETVRGMNSLFSGWDTRLAPFGARVRF